MAIDLSNVTSITIPEGEVIEISINGTTVWSAGPSQYIWTTIDNTNRTMSGGSASNYPSINQFATIPSDAVGLRLTLSYSANPNGRTFYGTNLRTLSMASVNNLLNTKPTTINTAPGGYQYLFAIRYARSATYDTETYMCYWSLQVSGGDKLSLIRSYDSSVSAGSSRGMYAVTITKIEALVPNPDLQA